MFRITTHWTASFGKSRSTVSVLGKIREISLTNVDTRLTQVGPRLTQIGPRLTQVGPRLTQVGPRLTQVGPRLTNVGTSDSPPLPQLVNLIFPDFT